jgi:O-acetyl-ADP-ribose deacetylase (regulator of RNase III)
LPASHVIHAVGPIWQGEAAGAQQILLAVIARVLDRPLVGISRYRIPCYRGRRRGLPAEAAARVAVTTIGSHLEEQQLPELVIFVCFDTATFNAYCNAVGYGGWE